MIHSEVDEEFYPDTLFYPVAPVLRETKTQQSAVSQYMQDTRIFTVIEIIFLS